MSIIASLASPSRAAPQLFLELEERLGALRACGERVELLAQRLDLLVALVTLDGLGTALLGREPCDGSQLALLAPQGQVRGVEPLFAEQFSERTVRLAGVGLLQDPELVLRREPAPRGLRHDLGRGILRGLLLVRRHGSNLRRPAQ
jgi:hypothetical protein